MDIARESRRENRCEILRDYISHGANGGAAQDDTRRGMCATGLYTPLLEIIFIFSYLHGLPIISAFCSRRFRLCQQLVSAAVHDHAGAF